MPVRAERNLKHAAKKQGMKPGSDRYNRYVYGTLRKIERRKKRRR